MVILEITKIIGFGCFNHLSWKEYSEDKGHLRLRVDSVGPIHVHFYPFTWCLLTWIDPVDRQLCITIQDILNSGTLGIKVSVINLTGPMLGLYDRICSFKVECNLFF